MIPKTEIYYASRKTASAHVYITKNGHGKVRVNNIPLEMIQPESAREVMMAPLEIIGCLLYTSSSPRDLSTSRMPSSA